MISKVGLMNQDGRSFMCHCLMIDCSELGIGNAFHMDLEESYTPPTVMVNVVACPKKDTCSGGESHGLG